MKEKKSFEIFQIFLNMKKEMLKESFYQSFLIFFFFNVTIGLTNLKIKIYNKKKIGIFGLKDL